MKGCLIFAQTKTSERLCCISQVSSRVNPTSTDTGNSRTHTDRQTDTRTHHLCRKKGALEGWRGAGLEEVLLRCRVWLGMVRGGIGNAGVGWLTRSASCCSTRYPCRTVSRLSLPSGMHIYTYINRYLDIYRFPGIPALYAGPGDPVLQ